MSEKPESTQQILARSAFRCILQRLELHAGLLKRIKEHLPAPLSAHCRYCVVRETGELLIFTDSPAWSSQLRFLASSVLEALNSRGDLYFERMSIRTLQPANGEKKVKRVEKPSAQTIALVNNSSKAVASEELAEALARLGAAMERYAGQGP